MDAEIKAIYISSGHDFFGRHEKTRRKNLIKSVQKVQCVAHKGIIGDRFFEHKDNYKGQITFFEFEVLKGSN